MTLLLYIKLWVFENSLLKYFGVPGPSSKMVGFQFDPPANTAAGGCAAQVGGSFYIDGGDASSTLDSAF
jgi:hypothetical protein